MAYSRKKGRSQEYPQVGEYYLIPLRNGQYLPFQILAQRGIRKHTKFYSICALLGTPYPNEAEAITAMPRWSEQEIVAEVTTLTSGISRYEGTLWRKIGQRVPLRKPSMLWNEQNLLAKIKIFFGFNILPTNSALSGYLFSLAHVFLGLEAWSENNPNFYEDKFTPNGSVRAKRLIVSKLHP